MKISTFAGCLCLAGALGFLAVIYLAGGRLSRDELYALAVLIGAGLLLLDPADMTALFQRVLDKLPWGKSQ